MCIAAWALLMGIFHIIAAIRLRKEIENEWLLGLSGALSVVFGLLMFFSPPPAHSRWSGSSPVTP